MLARHIWSVFRRAKLKKLMIQPVDWPEVIGSIHPAHKTVPEHALQCRGGFTRLVIVVMGLRWCSLVAFGVF